jgi:hypothetical protein
VNGELRIVKYGKSVPTIIFYTAYLILLLLVVSCASVEPVVKVGLVGPFEGKHRAVGYDVIYSARLAVREINAAGGIGGYRVALVALDDSGDPELARETAVSLTLDPAVVAVIGHWQLETTAVAADVYAEAGLVFITTNAAPFAATDPANYSAEFREAYELITPFGETPGPYAAAAYDAFNQLWQAMAEAAEADGTIDRPQLLKIINRSR